jgi:hypothetical protein
MPHGKRGLGTSTCPRRSRSKSATSRKRTRILGGTEPEDQVNKERVIEVPVDFKEEFEKDPDGAARDYGGVSILTIHPFITRRELVAAMFKRSQEAGLTHPYTSFTVTLQDGRERLLPENLHWIEELKGNKAVKRLHSGPYFAHIDLALTIDACGLAIGHVVGSKKVLKGVGEDKRFETKPIIRIDLVLQIIAPLHGEIIVSKVRGVLYTLRDSFGVAFGKVTYDSWNSAESIQTLKSEGFSAETYSLDTSPEGYEQLREAIYEERLECYAHSILETELVQLRMDERKQKIDHLPRGSKDCSDAVAGVVHHCEEAFAQGTTSDWQNITTVTAVRPSRFANDQDELWDLIARGVLLTEDQISRLR